MKEVSRRSVVVGCCASIVLPRVESAVVSPAVSLEEQSQQTKSVLKRIKTSKLSYARTRFLLRSKHGASSNKVYIAPAESVTENVNSMNDLDNEPAFPMHCVTIKDLLEFEQLPSFDEVARMGKFVIANKLESRPVVFISHQWSSYSKPDHSNQQFATLKAAFKRLSTGKFIRPEPFFDGMPGVPKKTKFDHILKDCLVWVDAFGIPQITSKYNFTEERGDTMTPAEKMSAAISSLPTYVAKSDAFFVLAPVVSHGDIEDLDCEFSTWQNRGWCRLEGVVRAMSSKDTYIAVIYTPERMRLMSADDFLYQRSAGCGDFACCSRNHTIDIEGVPTTIPCDRGTISSVLTPFFDFKLSKLEQEANDSREQDLSEYRLLLSRRHIILRNLPCIENFPKLDTWEKFAEAFRLSVDEPLKKSGGIFNWSPLIWAVLSNNAEIVKYLIERNANVRERAKVRKGAFCFYHNATPLFLIMAVGHGSAGKEIFDYLLDAGDNPYAHFSKTKRLRFKWGGPFSGGTLTGNNEMMLHFCKQVKPLKFVKYNIWSGTSYEVAVVICGFHDVAYEFNHLGAKFRSKDFFGQSVIPAFIQLPREYQRSADTRTLDVFFEHGKLTVKDVHRPALSGKLLNVFWLLMRVGIMKKKGFVRLVDELRGGTLLHTAVYFDKPSMVIWLLEKGVDKNQRTRHGQTALDLALEKKHGRCADILRGEQGAIRRYSVRRPSISDSATN